MKVGVQGLVELKLYDEKLRLKLVRRSKNIVTDNGDLVYANLSAGIAAQPPTMMMLGSISGTPAKNGTLANLTGRFALSGGQSAGDNSIRALDAGFPTVATKGAGLGYRVTYRCTWPPLFGVTNNTLYMGATGVILCNISPVPSSTGSTNPTNAQVIAVDNFASFNKAQQDTLVVTWLQDFLGST